MRPAELTTPTARNQAEDALQAALMLLNENDLAGARNAIGKALESLQQLPRLPRILDNDGNDTIAMYWLDPHQVCKDPGRLVRSGGIIDNIGEIQTGRHIPSDDISLSFRTRQDRFIQSIAFKRQVWFHIVARLLNQAEQLQQERDELYKQEYRQS